ncbi:MFS general substrate transporter [Exidia glandulosa HHB12029]|uniref:MFS general substrate transporter n=1 Tax=Exidia glandulosa HHB12029 TaxID=1314781 RepID=A0A165JD70_EXIGL|nr:MFS general substrate transporter [Exidia glandulosa HHB12029]
MAMSSANTSKAASTVVSLHSDVEDKRSSILVVGWDGPTDPANPRNWSRRRRWATTIVASLFAFMSPVASSMIAPSLPQLSADMGIQPGSLLQSMTLSIFVLAYAIGVLIWGPLSELLGRQLVLQVSNIFFLVFNIACGLAKTTPQVLAFRFLAGLGGAAPMAVAGGSVGDLWSPDERGLAMSIYSLAPLIGPATGPLVGGWVAQKAGDWRWVYWSTSIAAGILQLVAFLVLRETYPPIILGRKAARLRKETGDPHIRSVHDTGRRPAAVFFGGMVKPLLFLATEPIVQVFALYMAVLYGVLYLTLTTFVEVWRVRYGEADGLAGTHYLAVFLGSTVGGQAGSRVLDFLYRRLKARNGGVGTPEMRLPLLMVTATTLPIGLLIYGWTAEHRLFWLLPDIGVFIFSVGIGGNWLCIQTYLVDNYALLAASAIAAVSSFRAFAGFGFPLFADAMYSKLGDGWGNSILALVCLVIGCPAPFFFYRYGPKLRALSKHAVLEK